MNDYETEMKTHHTCAEVFSVGALTPVTQSFVSSGQNEGLKGMKAFYNHIPQSIQIFKMLTN